MTELNCQNCGNTWEYTGSKRYATCTSCYTKVHTVERATENLDEEEMVEEE